MTGKMPVLLKAKETGRLERLPHVGNPVCPAVSHIGVFGEGPGEGVFAKTSSPETLNFPPFCALAVTNCLLSYHYAGNDVFALFFHTGINFVCINAVKAICGFVEQFDFGKA